MMFDSEYTILATHLKAGRDAGVRVRGMRVGHLAVRPSAETVSRKVASATVGKARECRAYSVDHVPSRTLLADFSSLDHALRFADDAGRFAPDLGATAPRDVIKAFDPVQGAWIGACIENDYAIPFREFCAMASVRGAKTPVDGLVASIRDLLSARQDDPRAELDALAASHGVELVVFIVAELAEQWSATGARRSGMRAFEYLHHVQRAQAFAGML